ncbi:uncharacterized protein [Phyllobates terribilis]|uniref:uncharacterized protein n=1 Tax=Phyllobates terribilis TaxID=111132 RepID=UPI003CCB1D7A
MKNVQQSLLHPDSIVFMQEELMEFERNKVWILVPKPLSKTIIRNRWVFRNKLDNTRSVVENKARFVSQGYNHQEGIDYDETYASVALLEAIHLLIAFAALKGFKLYRWMSRQPFEWHFE